jgi:hypothetical protein
MNAGGGRQSAVDRSDEQPPILKSWRRLYAAVLLTLAVEVILFAVFTRMLA